MSSVLKSFYFAGLQIDIKISLTNQRRIVNFQGGISQDFGQLARKLEDGRPAMRGREEGDG